MSSTTACWRRRLAATDDRPARPHRSPWLSAARPGCRGPLCRMLARAGARPGDGAPAGTRAGRRWREEETQDVTTPNSTGRVRLIGAALALALGLLAWGPAASVPVR